MALRHSEEHFTFNPVANATATGKRPRKSDIEQVVSRDTDSNVLDALGRERVVEDSLVVRVRFLFRANGREFPAVKFRIDAFHRQVCALDHSNFDCGTASRTTLVGPFLEFDHSAQRIGKVSLENNARLESEELVAIENSLENRDGHVEVVVLLHVEVDELSSLSRLGKAVHRQK